jgi:hypothetical protein
MFLRLSMSIIVILSLIIFTEAITEIITKSELFSPVREFFFNRRKFKICNFIHKLLDCGYCMSVWVGLFSAYVFFFLNNIFFNVFFMGIILHRLSNILHFIIDRINRNSDLELE